MGIKINEDRCPQNRPCTAMVMCPAGALKQNGYKAPKVDMDKCIDCYKCIDYCPMGAILVDDKQVF